MMLESSRYEKWDRERDRGGGSGGGGGGGGAAAWAGRDRERDRERERQARAHQMSHANAAENDASSLFPAPIRVNNRDRVSQQIQIKLGDYHLAQTLLDDPSKSIGICAEPPSPAPCPPRRESEFKKPSHAPQNGRVHHRPYNYNKNDGSNSTAPSQHRPPPIRISNGYPAQHTIDSSQPPIESILKEMQALPNPISSIAATPRKETDNKFIFNPYTNKVQENPQLASTELKAPPPKPGLDNRISNSRSSVSPDVVHKDLGLSESDEETPAPSTTHPDPAHPDPAQLDPAQLDSAHFQTEPILSPIGSASPSTSESSPSDSESESSSAESAPPPAEAPPAQRPSWSLANFAPARPAGFDAANDLRHALADVKGKPIFSNFVREFVNADCTDPNQKWTNLALLKCSLRQSLLCFEYNLRYIVLEEDRAVMLAEFFRLKDILWQAIGGLHGSLMSAPFPSPISELSDSEVSSPSPKRRRRSVVNNQSSDDEAERKTNAKSPRSGGAKRGRPAKPRPEENPAKRRRGRPRKPPPAPPSPPAPRVPSPPPPAPPLTASDTKTHIFRKVFTPKKVDECGGKGGKGGKGKGGKGKGQVTIIEATAPEGVAHERHRDEIVARVSPPQEPETVTRKREAERVANERIQERVSIERSDSRPPDRPGHDRLDRPSHDRSSDRFDRSDRSDKSDRSEKQSDKSLERLSGEKLDKSHERLSETKSHDRLSSEKHERLSNERLSTEKISHDRLSGEKMSHDRLSGEKMSRDRLSGDKMSHDRLSVDQTSHDRLSGDKLSHERLSCDKMSDKMDRISMERYIRAEADVGSGLKSGRGSERLEEASSIASSRRRSRALVHIPLSRLRAATVRALQLAARRPKPKSQPPEVAPTNHERAASISISEQTPIYYSYFERLPADALSDEERDHKYYLGEAKRLRTTAESEQEPLARVMLYLESVLCFVLTGRVLELERDTKRAFTIYRETIEYIKSIHSMPQRFRASPHSTFSKLDILSLRVQALLYLRMFKMYNREVKEYNKIVQEYQQKPACPESVSPLSPTPSPAGSVTSVGSAASAASVASTSSGYCSLAHAVPAPAHNALLQLTKYYTFLYVAHELWEQADCLCRLRCNQDLFIAVDRKCGPLTLSSTFQHLVQYVRHAISLLKSPPRE